MLIFDKQEIRDSLSDEQIFELLQDWGGEPEYASTGIVSRTICHHKLNEEASRKLYYYSNTGLFRCYTGCEEPVFDIFQLVIKIMKLQHNLEYDLNDAVRWIAQRFGLSGKEENQPEIDELEDWKIFADYNRIQDIQVRLPNIILKEYDDNILEHFNYDIKITPWLKEGISQKAIINAEIGFYPGGDQITIPHFDKDGRFIGLRGRTLSEEDAERYGKYRPIKVNNILYNHPLGMNLYNFNNSRRNIPKIKKAIIFESEKSCLLYQTYFGFDNDISVACCGSSISNYQIQLLLDAGVQEIVIAFDRQFQSIGDKEFNLLKKKILSIYNKYKNYVNISFIWDKNKITSYKASPIDEGKNKFLQLFKERIIL